MGLLDKLKTGGSNQSKYNGATPPTNVGATKESKLHAYGNTPGFSLGRHFDNRFVFANFILNLVDNPVSTKFYDYTQNNKLIYEAPKEKGKGVFFLNYENTCHSYINDSFENRYGLISSVNLKLF